MREYLSCLAGRKVSLGTMRRDFAGRLDDVTAEQARRRAEYSLMAKARATDRVARSRSAPDEV